MTQASQREPPHDSAPPRERSIWPLTILLLLLTATIAVCWSHVKLLSQDEFFVLQTDSVSSVRQLIHIQRTVPISLDPLVYHLLAHACSKLFGPTALALRLPSIFGFLLMQLCLFLIVRPIAGARAGLVALAFPALTATLYYAPEARPYGLLLGFYALTLLAWQRATHSPSATRAHRSRSLVLLAIAIALALNTHYFAILLLVPLCAAELARTLQRRRIDWPVIFAIVIGAAGIVFALPFQRAAAQFRGHYYNAGGVSIHSITQAYRSLFVNYNDQGLLIRELSIAGLTLAAAVLLVAVAVRLRKGIPSFSFDERVFVAILVALPYLGYLLALFITHSFEVRYVLGSLIGVSILIALAASPLLRAQIAWRIAIALLFVLIALGGYIRIRAEQRKSQAELASFVVPATLKARLLSLPDQHLYFQDMGHFEIASYYEPDPTIRARMTLLYSREEELKYDHHDTVSLTAEHMRSFTGFTIVPYAQLKQQPGEHMLVLYHSGWDWTDQALAAEDIHHIPYRPALDGDAVIIEVPRAH